MNSKFDVVQGRIVRQRPIPSLMKVYIEMRLEEDKVRAMNFTVVSTKDSAAFSVKLSGSNSDKQNGKHTSMCEHCNKYRHTKEMLEVTL